ncbi:hypothetical protein HDE_07443 [Halotydeus destructor]|nr:hypothetical protein HDE_07443 [Halotydeus destructor]
MPQTITLTRTTTTTTSASAIIINTGYLRTLQGSLRALQTVFGLVCFLLMLFSCDAYYDRWQNSTLGGFGGGKAETSLLLVAFTFTLCTALILMCCLASLATAALLSRTNFEVVYHVTAFLFYLLASLILLIEVISRNERSYAKENGYAGKIAASVFGLIVSCAYLVSTVLSYRSYSV